MTQNTDFTFVPSTTAVLRVFWNDLVSALCCVVTWFWMSATPCASVALLQIFMQIQSGPGLSLLHASISLVASLIK